MVTRCLEYSTPGYVEVFIGPDQVNTYDVWQLSTASVLFTHHGSVFRYSRLWIEQFFVMVIFLLSTGCTYKWNLHDYATQSSLGGFADRMATLAAFLLGFYTSLTVSRWWRLRTDGIGNIWSASSQLCLLLSQFVTSDQQLLSAIRRYARASLAIVFMRRSYGDRFPEHLKDLHEAGILTTDEIDSIHKWESNHSESIWTWTYRIIADLHREGLIKSDMLLTLLLEKVNMGRSGAALIGAQMGTPIPLPYVHLIGILVKVHNILIALSYGYIFGDFSDFGAGDKITLVMKIVFVPFLYNSLLLINAELSDPFNADRNDFPLNKYQTGIENDGISYIEAGKNIPAWLESFNFQLGKKSDKL